MATQVQLRRGTNAWHQNFTGAIGETTVNTTDFSLHVHDGVTPGGHKLQTLDGVVSFKERSGAIVPMAGDYSAGQVSVAPSGDLKATDVQAALAELNVKDNAVQKQVTVVEAKTNDAAKKLEALGKKLSEGQKAGVVSFQGRTGAVAPMTGDYSAMQVSVVPAGDLKATDVQAALAELDGKDSAAVNAVNAVQRKVTAVESKASDTADGLDALNKKVTSLSGQIVEAQNKAGVVSFQGRTGAVAPMAGDYSAMQVSVVPAGDLKATDVQAALVELDGKDSAAVNAVNAVQRKVTAVKSKASDTADGLDALNKKVTSLSGQIAEAQNKAGVASFKNRTGAVAPMAGDYSAGQVSVAPAGDLKATDVQAALLELDGKDSAAVNAVNAVQRKVTAVESKASDTADGLDALNKKVTSLSGQIAEAQNKAGVASFKNRTGAIAPMAGDYSATQVSVTPTGALKSADVQAALSELDARVAQASGVTSFRSRTGAIAPMAGDYSANLIGFTPTGALKSADVQAALTELDTRVVQANSAISADRVVTARPIGPAPVAGQPDKRIAVGTVSQALDAIDSRKISSPDYLEEREALEADFLPFQSATGGIAKVSIKNLFSRRMMRGYTEQVDVVKGVAGRHVLEMKAYGTTGNVRYLVLDGDATILLPNSSYMSHDIPENKGGAFSLTIVLRQNKIGGHAVTFYDSQGNDTLLWDANGIQPSIATGPNQETMFSFFLVNLFSPDGLPRWKAVRVHKGG